VAIYTDQYSVATSAASLLAQVPANAPANVIVTQPNTTNTLYIGGSNVTAANGLAVGGPAATGGPISVTLNNFSGSLFGIALTGAVTAQVYINTVER